MAVNNDIQLDQLWFTSSTSGLGSMAMGFRVRAASEGLHDIQGMRYRRVNRFLPYELPQGANISDFNSRIAPVSLCFVTNGDENLLIRKVFTGLDAAGRNGNFFTHLIAGLPQNFTARDAIRLWACSELWAESDQGKASNDTLLPKIPYSTIRAYVQNSQTMFNVTQISEQLQNLEQVILSQGLPQHIYTTGHSTFTASLIYGLTHCLPTTLLDGLTFSTYESKVGEIEAILIGTISGANLSDTTTLQVHPSAPSGPLSDDVQRYARIALNSFTTGNMTKFSKMVDEAERNRFGTSIQLLELFNRRFRHGPLTIKQLEHMVQSPNDNIDDLLDPDVQQEAADLLLRNQEYWQTAGKNLFIGVVAGLQLGVNRFHTPEALQALTIFINGVNNQIIAVMQQTILQGVLPKHHVDILNTLAPLATNAILYQKMLSDFAQGETYQKAISDVLWGFQLWLLQCAKLIQPQPTLQQVQPWLRTPSWNKLEGVLKLDLPIEWEQLAIFGLLERDIPKGAVPIVQTYETKFTTLLQRLLQQGCLLPRPDYTETVVRFFTAMVIHEYPRRVTLLIDLLNTSPKEPSVIEKLLSVVRFGTPYQLIFDEIENLLTNCFQEVIAACSSSPTLAEYIREYMRCLTPGKFANEPIQQFLTRLRAEPSLPTDIANLASHWTAIADFLHQNVMSRQSLRDVGAAFQHLFPVGQMGGNDQQRQMMIAELLPLLVKQIQSEHDLENVIEVLIPFLTSNSWDLLCRMTILAGQIYRQSDLLYRLTPYMLCGISKFPRKHDAPDVLDTYLDYLYGNLVDKSNLKNVDSAVVSGVWPVLVQQTWRRWYESRKPVWGENIPLVNKFIPQQHRQPTGPQPTQQPFSSHGHSGSPAPVGNYGQAQIGISPSHAATYQGTAAYSQQTQITPLPTSSMGNSPANVGTQTPPLIQLQIDASVYDHRHTVTVKEFQALHYILVEILPYWLGILNTYLNKNRSKSVTLEVNTISSLQEELHKLPPTIASPKLIEYILDDELLQLEINRIDNRGKTPTHFLRPENHLVSHRDDFQRFVGDFAYRTLCQKYNEKSINEALALLIRRYHFIQHMDDQRKDWRKWLEKEKKHVTIEFPKDMNKK